MNYIVASGFGSCASSTIKNNGQLTHCSASRACQSTVMYVIFIISNNIYQTSSIDTASLIVSIIDLFVNVTSFKMYLQNQNHHVTFQIKDRI